MCRCALPHEASPCAKDSAFTGDRDRCQSLQQGWCQRAALAPALLCAAARRGAISSIPQREKERLMSYEVTFQVDPTISRTRQSGLLQQPGVIAGDSERNVLTRSLGWLSIGLAL